MRVSESLVPGLLHKRCARLLRSCVTFASRWIVPEYIISPVLNLDMVQHFYSFVLRDSVMFGFFPNLRQTLIDCFLSFPLFQKELR